MGKLAARLLSVEFADIDEEIVRKTGKSIKELFSLYGEEGFRRIEQECLAEKLEEGFRIVSCGGGIVLREENRTLLRQKAVTVWIRRSPEKVLENQNVLERPPVNGDRSRYLRLLRERTPLYRDAAGQFLQNRSAESTAKRLCRLLERRGREEAEKTDAGRGAAESKEKEKI